MKIISLRTVAQLTMAAALLGLTLNSAADEAPRKSFIGVDDRQGAYLMIMTVNGERVGRSGQGRRDIWLPPGEYTLGLELGPRGPNGQSNELEYDLTVEPGVDYRLHALRQGEDIFEFRVTPRD